MLGRREMLDATDATCGAQEAFAAAAYSGQRDSLSEGVHERCSTGAQASTSSVGDPDRAMLAHRRMGHINLDSMEHIIAGGMVHNAPCTVADIRALKQQLHSDGAKCESCLFGKMTRQSFPSTKHKAPMPLSVLHSDVCGPYNVYAEGGYRFFAVFVDGCTGFTWVELLKQKSDLAKVLPSVIGRLETMCHSANGSSSETLLTNA